MGTFIHRCGQNDLAAGLPQLLEPIDEMLQRRDARTMHLHDKAIAACHMKTLLYSILHFRHIQEPVPVRRGHRNADERINGVFIRLFAQNHRISGDDPAGFHAPDALADRRAGERHPLGNVLDRHTAQMRVWERGSGETLACGTGACAVAVACALNGLTEDEVTVKLLGGDLQIKWDREKNTVYMTGPAEVVFDGEWK